MRDGTNEWEIRIFLVNCDFYIYTQKIELTRRKIFIAMRARYCSSELDLNNEDYYIWKSLCVYMVARVYF